MYEKKHDFPQSVLFLTVLAVGGILSLMKTSDVSDYLNPNLVTIELFLGHLNSPDWLTRSGRKATSKIYTLRDWIHLWTVC